MLTNGDLAELLTREAGRATGSAEPALRRAAKAAFLWPLEVEEHLGSGRTLPELPGVTFAIARRLERWLARPPADLAPPPQRAEFRTRAEALRILARHPRQAARVRGDLQMHTVWSDGEGTIAEMAAAGVARGYQYVAITDHAAGLTVAHGLDERRLAEQREEITVLNEALAQQQTGLTLLQAVELNLSPTGEGDLPPAVLRRLELVLGCFHTSLRREDDQTRRYLAGLRHPEVHILGHPQTRRYDKRVGLRADWARVFAEAARLDKAVELDCYLERQDLRPSLLPLVKKEGARLSLGTDSHHPEQLIAMELGLAAALEAGIPDSRILNFLPLAKLRAWVASHRAARA